MSRFCNQFFADTVVHYFEEGECNCTEQIEQDKLTKKQKHCWSLPHFEFFNQQLDFTKNVYNRKGDVCNIFTCQKRNFFVITIDLSIQFVAGLDGIKNKLEAPAPIDRNIYVMTKEERLENGIV
ncbi:hypothetical protein EX342_21460, partial [Bacillus paralicheniformis]